MSKKCSATVELNPCEKFSFATCDGCHQSFCLPHLNDHQQDLANQMEKVVHDHNLLREKLDSHRNHSEVKVPDFSHEHTLIDEWEKGVLDHISTIIRAEAERARRVIRHVTRENQQLILLNNVALSEEVNRLKNLLTVLGKQLQARTETMDYLESDLREWQTQLNDIEESSSAPEVRMSQMINKISVRETRQIQINVTNVLGIVYVDEEGNTVAVNSSEENDLIQGTKKYDPEVFDYTNRRHYSGESRANTDDTIGDQKMSYASKGENEKPGFAKLWNDKLSRFQKSTTLNTSNNDANPRTGRKKPN